MRKTVSGFLWKSIPSIILASVNFIYGDRIVDFFERGKIVIFLSYFIPLLLFIYFCYLLVTFRADFWESKKPIFILKEFLQKKIKQGNRIYKKHTEAENDKLIMEYRLWRESVGEALAFSFKNLQTSNGVDFFSKNISPYIAEIDYEKPRLGLVVDIEGLKTLEKRVKSNWLKDDFKPENLEDYLDVTR